MNNLLTGGGEIPGCNKWSTEDVAIETQGRRWMLETSRNGPKKGNPLHLNMETTQKKNHTISLVSGCAVTNAQWGGQPNWVLVLMASQTGVNFVPDMTPEPLQLSAKPLARWTF